MIARATHRPSGFDIHHSAFQLIFMYYWKAEYRTPKTEG